MIFLQNRCVSELLCGEAIWLGRRTNTGLTCEHHSFADLRMQLAEKQNVVEYVVVSPCDKNLASS